MTRSFQTFIFAFLLISTPCEAAGITGRDWMLMTTEEKGTYIFTAMDVLKAHGVPLSKTPSEYSALINAKLIDDPDTLKTDVTNILATVVRDEEPAAREAIDEISKR